MLYERIGDSVVYIHFMGHEYMKLVVVLCIMLAKGLVVVKL